MPGKFNRIGISVPLTETESAAHDFARHVLEMGVTDVAVEFKDPDDDWQSIWIILTAKQGTIVTPAPDVDKYEATDYVAKLARRWGAIAIGHLHSSWMVSDEAAAAAYARGGSTEGLPRDEILLMATYTAGGARQYTARINRHEHTPPTLDPFELMIDTTQDGAVHVQGAMVTPLMQALQRVG